MEICVTDLDNVQFCRRVVVEEVLLKILLFGGIKKYLTDTEKCHFIDIVVLTTC